jgi:hypothetical protein
MRRALFCAYLFVLSLVGAGLIIYGTNLGIGLYPDSVVYISASRSFLSGNGFTTLGPTGNWVTLTHFPPFFPFLLSSSWIWHQDPLAGARWISTFFFAITILLTGLILRKIFPSSFWFPLLVVRQT